VYGDIKENVTIAGIFNIYDEYGNVDYVQLEHLSAFVLAINDINARTDILNDVHLNYIIRSGIGATESTLTAIDISKHPDNIISAVTALSFEEVNEMSSIFAENKIVLASSVDDASDFSNGIKYPYLVNSNPLAPSSAHIQQVTFCLLGTQGIVIFASNDEWHTYSAYEASNNDVCKLTVRAKYMFDPETTDFSVIISNALNIQSTVMLIYTNAKCAALLLEQGYNAGLFRKGVMIIVGEDISNADMIPYFSSSTDIGSVLKSALGENFWPKYYILAQSANGVTFMKKWTKQNSTQITCNTTVDSDGNFYLYQNSDKLGGCVGLNFSSYKSDGSNLNDYTAYTYDATYLIAYGLQHLRNNNKLFTGENLLSAVIYNVSFSGPTGPFYLLKGKPLENKYGIGNRGGALAYRILNFKETIFYADNSKGFSDVVTVLSNGQIVPCNRKLLTCFSLTYNTLDGAFANGYPPYAFSSLPKFVKIGGLFAPLDSNGYPNKMQMEMFAAFKMAITEINNKKDGLYDTLLPSTTILYDLQIANGYLDALNSAQSLIDAFYYSGVKAVISGLPNDETKASHSIFSADGNDIFQLNSFASDSALVDGLTYKYKAQLVPIDSYEGAVLQDLICTYFNYRKVAFISSNDDFGQAYLNEMTIYRDYCEFDQLLNLVVPISESDYSSYIDELKVSGARVIILLVSGSTAASIIELGFQSGIFGEDYQIFTSSLTASTMISSFSDNADISTLMKGIIYAEFWPDYAFNTDSGKQFLTRWREQTYRGQSLYQGILQCDKSLDDRGDTYIYQSQNGTICAGLNFSSYSIDKPDLTPYALFTYDAVYALARGLDNLVKAGSSINGDSLRDVLLTEVNFTGVTGLVEFENTDINELYFSRGDRDLGIHYKIMNFNADAYKNNASNSFVQVLQWTNLEGVHDCDNFTTCTGFIFCSEDNTVVKESESTIIKTMPVGGIVVLALISFIIIVMVVIYTGLTIRFYNSKLVKAAQPEMLICILLGVLLAAGRVLIAAFPINEYSCISGLWLAHLSFVLAFGALFIKTYRVHIVLNSKNFKRVVFTGSKAMKYMSAALLVFIILLIILTAVGRPHRSYNSSTTSNQTTKTVRCAFHRPQIHTALFILEAVIIFVGARLCLAVKDVPDAVNESKFIAIAITFILMLAVLVFPIVFLLGLEPVVYQIIASVSFGVAAIVTVNAIFLPKAISILSSQENHINLKHKKKHKVVVPVNDANNEGHVSITQTSSIPLNINGVFTTNNNVVVNQENIFEVTKAIVSKMKPDDKTRFCYENISNFQAMLLNVHSNMSQGSSHASNSMIDNVEPLSNTL